MFRKVFKFYVLSMVIAFLITIWTGLRGTSEIQVFMHALLAWPAAALFMVAAAKYRKIRATEIAKRQLS